MRTTFAIALIASCATMPVTYEQATRIEPHYIALHQGQSEIKLSGEYDTRARCELVRRNVRIHSSDAWTVCTKEKGPGRVNDRAE